MPTLHTHLRSGLLTAALVLGGAASAAAQDTGLPIPRGLTAEQARQMLRERPDAARLLQERLRESGLTPNEVRARLRAAGYPSTLLDAYLTGDTLPGPQPSSQTVDAISRLGLARFSRHDSLLLRGDSVALRLFRDSLRLDSILLADSLATRRRGLTLFGLDVFRQPTTQFQPIATGPVDDSYVLGPGDEVVVVLTGGVEAAHAVEVTQGGFIVVPQVGQVNVNGLRLGEVREVLYQRLRRVYSSVGRGPDARTRFDLTIATVRVQRIRVIGEVARPGTYVLAATGGVLAALYEAGGPTEMGNFRAVEVRRGSRLLGTVDLYDYLVGGVTPADLQLGSGDVVFVPVRGARVKITGEVARPGIYEVRAEESVGALVGFAGGLTPLAATHAATVFRLLPPAERTEPGRVRSIRTEPLGEILLGRATGAPLAAGDSAVVYSVAGGQRNAVAIAGGVWQPGTYQVDPGMRLSDLIRMAGGVRPEAYPERVTILRTLPDSTRQMLAVALGADGLPRPAEDPELREQDEVTVFSRTEHRPLRYVEISGAVAQPGRIVHAEGMTVRDAILLAGGPTESAYLMEAEVSRMRGGAEAADTLAAVIRVPLDSSFLLDPTGPFAPPTGTRATDVVLQPYDNVFVRQQPGWERPQNVVLTGLMRFPGRYTILRKGERLSDVLARAGGLTAQAHPNGIQFYRRGREVPDQGLAPLDVRPDTSAFRPAPTSLAAALTRDTLTPPTRYVPEELRAAPHRTWGWVGRLGVDLAAVRRDPSHRDNVVLEAGDSIHIPAYVPFVRVEGAVNSPTTVAYRPRAGVGYYVNGAGGFTENAHKKGTFVLQPTGKVVKGGHPEPGAVVVVPDRDPRIRRTDLWQVFAAIAPAVASLATVIIVLSQ
jgi:protein involved in polysaccharide export with SLBB domain